MSENVKKMRNGEKIKCPRCENGYIAAVGNPKIANVFKCDTCKTGMTLTVPYKPKT
jgi:uncharacterized protein (DUF983 family)